MSIRNCVKSDSSALINSKLLRNCEWASKKILLTGKGLTFSIISSIAGTSDVTILCILII